MDTQLAVLEDRIRKVVALCQNLRKENIALRQDVASGQQQIKTLNTKLEAARIRILSLIERLPEDA
jgi:cell division protein ZapB